MKTILVPTDLSASAENAAKYAYQLAQKMGADIRLFNAIVVPEEAPMAGQIVWPLEDYESLQKEVTEELKNLADKLTSTEVGKNHRPVYLPKVKYTSEVGEVTDLVRNIVAREKVNLVAMGMSGAGALNRFFLGSASRKLIDKAEFPLLLIPSHCKFAPVEKIAIATDLSKADVGIICSLANLARPLNAEILVAHITTEKYDAKEHEQRVDDFLNDITCKANYPKIYYRHIKARDVDDGLEWLTEHGLVDMIAIVHRHFNIIDRLFVSSHTKHMANHAQLPLLVFPREAVPFVLPVF